MTSRSPGSRDWREPLFLLFLLFAAVLIVLVVFNRTSNSSSEATFAGDRPTATDVATPVPLPTAEPTALPPTVTSQARVVYSAEAVSLIGEVPAPATAEALALAAEELVGDAVTNDLTVVEGADPAGSLLVIEGEVVDEDERELVVAAFRDAGLPVEDALVLAGSDLSVVEAIGAVDELSQVSDFLGAAGLSEELSGEGPFTVFAPTNAAIEDLDAAALAELSEVDQLADVLRFHVVEGSLAAADLADGDVLTTLQGEELTVVIDDGEVTIAGVAVTETDIVAANGVVHVLDGVLLPGTLATEIALNRIVELDPVQFAAGSSDLLDESVPILTEAAEILVQNPVGSVEIEGHTDSSGDEETNLELSQERADAVRDFLIEEGVDADRLTATGYGETRLLVDPDESDEDKATNRRIEFRVG